MIPRRTRRGSCSSRRPSRHIRRTLTMWGLLYICVHGISLFPSHLISYGTFLFQAIHGQAIDRHFLGLKMLSIEDLTSMPEIFMDTSFAVAQHYNLSTSQACLRTITPSTGVFQEPEMKNGGGSNSARKGTAVGSGGFVVQALEDGQKRWKVCWLPVHFSDPCWGTLEQGTKSPKMQWAGDASRGGTCLAHMQLR